MAATATMALLLQLLLQLLLVTAVVGGRRNVLYLVFDDLRPDLSMYTRGAPAMHTPHLQKLADTGLVFERAYAQQTVCSPSRMSFTTGRRPRTTKAWNFLRHFRQAECASSNRVVFTGEPLAAGTTRHPGGVSFNASDGNIGMTGGSGQCCTDCSSIDGCVGWTMVGATCTLFSSVTGSDAQACPDKASHPSGTPCLSGRRGAMPTWTPLPMNFKDNGYLVLGVGKYFHDVNKGLGVPGDPRYPPGTGLPPLADPSSWSNVSAQNRNYSEMQEEYGRFNQILEGCPYTGGTSASNFNYTGGFGYVNAMDGCRGKGVQYCAAEGVPLSGAVSPAAANAGNTTPFCDRIAADDAIKKLEYAVTQSRPFFLAVGIRRPHLTFRAPAGYYEMYNPEQVALPTQLTLDESIDPIAWTQFAGLGGNDPHNRTNTFEEIKTYRAAYYAAVSWADYCAGLVLSALDRLELSEDTAVIVHSDHGWHLGEYNMWEKRTLWENAAHVPLIMRVPWMKASLGQRTAAIVELVDVYATLCDLMAVPLPSHDTYPVEGTSMVPLLQDPTGSGWDKTVGLTVYPRCPREVGEPREDWEQNSCIHSTEAADFGWMGYSMRIDHSDGCSYRFTMWPRWNGSALQPIWSDVRAVELYNHTDLLQPTQSDFDSYENKNLANHGLPFWQPRGPETPLVAELTAILKHSFGFAATAAGDDAAAGGNGYGHRRQLAPIKSDDSAVQLDVDFGEFLSTADHVWDWRWQQRHVLALSDLSGDLQQCGTGGAKGPCCIVAAGSSRHPTLAPCAGATQWTFSPLNGTIASGRQCVTLAAMAAHPAVAAAPLPPPAPSRFEVVMEECSPNSTVWIQHQNAFQPLGLPATSSGLEVAMGHGPPAYCLQVDTTGPDWCDGIMCAKSSAKPLATGNTLLAVPCHNGDRRQYWQTKNVGVAGDPSINNYVPLSWATAAYVGNGLVGVRVQNEGRTVAQGSRTLGGIGALQIDIDNLLLGQGKRRQANGYWRLTLADNSSQTKEYRVQMRTRLHQAVIEGNVTEQNDTSETLVANFSLFVSANLSLPVVVLQCDRYDGEACGLEFLVETKQDFTSFNTTTMHSNKEAAPTVRRLTAFAALYAGRHSSAGLVAEAEQPLDATGAAAQSGSAAIVAEAVRVGHAQILREHLAWWRDYWPQSFVSLGGPTATQVEQHYWTQMYRFPTSDRVALNGIIGDLGPTGFSGGNWNSDYYDDMNEELMYWISPASNRPSIATGIRKPGTPVWMLHNSWKQYDFEGDDASLRNIIFPALKSQVAKQVGTNDTMVGGSNGTFHIGRCNSPEYGCFAPVLPGSTCSVANGHYKDCSYSLAQLRWGLTVLVQLNDKFKLHDPAVGWWRALLDHQLAPFPTDETGYRLSVDCPFACPHRHFSHLLQIYDLEVVDPSTALSLRSIDHYFGLTCNTSENWFTESCRGYSVCGIAGMNAVAGRRSAAQGNISFSLDTIIVPNGLYGENEMFNHPDVFGPTGESSYCLAGVLHTMLSHTTQEGVLQICAGIDTWDAAYHNLRAAGGLLVSASRRNGTTEFVRVQSVATRNVSISVPYDQAWVAGAVVKTSPPSVTVVSSKGEDGAALWSVALAANESVVLYVVGAPPFSVRPLPSNESEHNRYGYSRPFPPQK
jgi:arylsulfatase A-like enzyme